LLDCGAGTGRFAQEIATACRVLVLDDHEESLQRLRSKFPEDRVLQVSATGIPLESETVDAITALDVLEHIEGDHVAVKEMGRVLKRGGVLVATVPASMALWSDWDEALHHFRRYNRDQFLALFPADEWEIVYVNYTNVLVYPLVWSVRKLRHRLKRRSAVRSEDRVPPRWLNVLLTRAFVSLGTWRIPFPFGVSLILVARRRVA
jgi:ubiquinone/menaquinone biosynthesis C-methylase UbiE